MDWNSVMADQPFSQRVARVAGEGWGCLFAGMHLALKEWLGRKRSAQVLVGLQALGCGHLAMGLAYPRREIGSCPHVGTPGVGAGLPWAWARPVPLCGDTWHWGWLAQCVSQARTLMWDTWRLGCPAYVLGQPRAPIWRWGWLAICPRLMDPASGLNFHGSFVRIQGY